VKEATRTEKIREREQVSMTYWSFHWNEKSKKQLLLAHSRYLLDAKFASNSSPLEVSCIGCRPGVTIHTIVTTVKAVWLHRLK